LSEKAAVEGGVSLWFTVLPQHTKEHWNIPFSTKLQSI